MGKTTDLDLSNEIVVKRKEETAINQAGNFDAETLIGQAIQKGLPVETMERLLAMRKELKAEHAREQFFEALSNFQAQMPKIEKTRAVKAKNGDIKYKYANIDDIVEQVKTPLKDNGFSYTVKTDQSEKGITVICEAHHAAGHSETSSLYLPYDNNQYISSIQNIMSSLSYAKRYCLCNSFGIVTSDEDNDATPPPPAEKSADDKIKDKIVESMNKILEINNQETKKDAGKNNRREIYNSICRMLKFDPVPEWDKLTSQQIKDINVRVSNELIKATELIKSAEGGD